MYLRRRVLAPAAGLTAALVIGSSGAPAAADDGPPPTPSHFYVNGVTDTTVSMQWSPGYLTEPTSWRVYQNDRLLTESRSSAFVARELAPGDTYAYRVVAVDGDGDTAAPTRTITVTTRGPGVAPGGPSGLRATEVSPTRVTLEFDRPGDEFDVTSYQVFDGATPVATTGTGVFAQPTATVALRRLQPESTHTLTVRAVRGDALSAPSNALTVTTPATSDTTAPGVPADTTAELAPYGCDAVAVRWSESRDDVDSPAELDYEVLVNGSVVSVVQGAGHAAVRLPDPGTHAVTVRAVDTSGNTSAESAPARVTAESFCGE